MKKGSFVKINYTAKVLDENIIVDTTLESVAKKEGLYNSKIKYEPIIICVGEGHVVPGLDKDIEDKTSGKHKIKLSPEQAFGKKNPKLLSLVPLKIFKQQNINPFPGLEVEIDGQRGIVKTGGSRVIVDFNHPLSGKEIEYEYEILEEIKDKKIQVESIIKLIGLKPEVKLEKDTIKIKGVPKQLYPMLEKEIKRLVDVKQLKFEK